MPCSVQDCCDKYRGLGPPSENIIRSSTGTCCIAGNVTYSNKPSDNNAQNLIKNGQFAILMIG